MNKRFHFEFKQGTDEWLEYKLGKVSASFIGDIMPGKTGRYRAARDNRLWQIIPEIVNGEAAEHFETDDMRRGTELEPAARAEYEFRNGPVKEIGFIDHPTIKDAGASTDGIIEGQGILEIKCRKTANHMRSVLTGYIPENDMYQMQFGIDCAQVDFCDYVLFDDRLTGKLEKHRYYCKRVYPDKVMIAKIRQEIVTFQAEIKSMLDKI